MFGISWLTDKIAAGIAGFLLVSTIALGASLAITRTTLHTRTVELAAEKSAHEADIQKWAAATATAQLQDQQHSDAVKSAQDKITTEKNDDIQNKLSDAHAAVASFVRKQAADHQRSSNASSVPAAPDATGNAAAADQTAVVSVDDLNACAQAVTVAQGWQDWWKAQSAVDRDSQSGSDVSAELRDRSNEPGMFRFSNLEGSKRTASPVAEHTVAPIVGTVPAPDFSSALMTHGPSPTGAEQGQGE